MAPRRSIIATLEAFASAAGIRRLAVAVACLAMLAASSPAPAQDAQGAEMMVLSNPVTKRTVERAKAIFALTPEQASMVNDLYAGHRAASKTATRTAAEKMREAMEAAAKDNAWDEMHKRRAEMMKTMTESFDKLNATFKSDLKAILTPEQDAKFPAFERAWRRDWARLLTFMAADCVDFPEILEEHKVPWRDHAEMASAIEAQEVAVDRVYTQRATMIREMFAKMTQSGREDETAKEFIGKLYEQAKQAQDANRQAARRLAEMLPEDKKAPFETSFRERSFPGVYRPSPTAKRIAAAAKLNDLSDSQKSELESMRTAFEREALAANKAWASAIDTAQAAIALDATKLIGGDTPGEEDVEKARDARRTLDKSYADRIDKLLTPEQVSRLPVISASEHLRGGLEPDMDTELLKSWMGEDE